MKSTQIIFAFLLVPLIASAQNIQFEKHVDIRGNSIPTINFFEGNNYRGRLFSFSNRMYLDSYQRELHFNGTTFTFASYSGDDAKISSDLEQAGGDMFLISNDAVIAQINKNLNNQGNFFVWDGNSTNLFQVTYNGNVYAQASVYSGSDRNNKENIKNVSENNILQAILDMPISEWQYKGENRRHIGPMAQDFHAAFGLGDDDTVIASVDADGVAFAAIKAQQKIIEKQRNEIDNLKKQVEELFTLIRESN